MITSTDPIADMLTRIRNASAVRQHAVSMPHSKLKESVAKLLAEKGFIDKVDVKDSETGPGRLLTLELFESGSNARITEIERISRPGRRTYASADNIPVVKRGRGIIIISTSKGIMTGDQAKQAGIGGELICKVF